MSAAPLAAAAAALALLAAWDLLAAAEGLAPVRAVGRRLAPLLAAGRGGREPSPPERRRLALLGAAVLLAGGWLVTGPLAGLALAAGGPSAAGALLRRRARRHRAELERGAPALARALADALGAGHSIRGALAEVARGLGGATGAELAEAARGLGAATGAELARAAGALALGEPTDAVLERLRVRAGCRSYDTIVAAILLQRDAGGDLARLLREVAAAGEAALRLAEDARAATAQARFTGAVVTVMPAGAAALVELAAPGALAALARNPLSAWLAGFALVLQALALVAIRRLGRVAE